VSLFANPRHPFCKPLHLLPVVGSLGELAGAITKHLRIGREGAIEGVVADKPIRVYVWVCLDEKVLSFSVNIDALRIRRRKIADLITLEVHNLKRAFDARGDRHADIEIVFGDGVAHDGADHRAFHRRLAAHVPDGKRVAIEVADLRAKLGLARRAREEFIVPALAVIASIALAGKRDEDVSEVLICYPL